MRRSAAAARGFLCLFLCGLLLSGVVAFGSFVSGGQNGPAGAAADTRDSVDSAYPGGQMRAGPDLMVEAFEIPLVFLPSLEWKSGRSGGKNGDFAVPPHVSMAACRLYAAGWPEAVRTGPFIRRITDALHEQDGMK